MKYLLLTPEGDTISDGYDRASFDTLKETEEVFSEACGTPGYMGIVLEFDPITFGTKWLGTLIYKGYDYFHDKPIVTRESANRNWEGTENE